MKTPDNIYVLILAGGVGARFWPESREDLPKQFLDILGVGRSLLQLTYDRFSWVGDDHILIVTNEKYRAQIREQLPTLRNDQIIGEPSRNNTAPCIAYASMKLKKTNPDAVCIVVPSDHVILKEQAFRETIEQAVTFAGHTPGSLVTLGIQPTRPDTGYGYIEYERHNAHNGVYPVSTFREKPDNETAQRYIASGNFVWNSGMFVWTVNAVLEAFERHANQIYSTLAEGKRYLNTPEERAFIQEAYPKTESISVDYAIMERSDKVFTIPADIGWSDLGTWASLYAYLAKESGETIAPNTNLVSENTTGCLVRAGEDKLVVLRDLHNYIVIDTDDVLLVYPKNKEQEIKPLLKDIDPRYK